MIKIVMFVIILIPANCLADVSGYLFLGKYLNHQQNLEGNDIIYKAGLYLEIESKWPTLFIKEETLISNINNGKSYPKQINYTIGMKQEYKNLELIMK